MVEFTMVAPLFLLLCVAGIDFGRVFHSLMTLTAAAETGARYACQSSAAAADINGITAAVASAAGNPGNLSVATTAFCTCTPGGLQVACSTSCSGKAAYTKIRAPCPSLP